MSTLIVALKAGLALAMFLAALRIYFSRHEDDDETTDAAAAATDAFWGARKR